MNNSEKLAILTALKKAVDAQLKEVRAVADEELRIAYTEDGVEKKALKVGGAKVGEFGVTYASDGFEITDRDAFMEFAADYGLASVRQAIRPDAMGVAIHELRQQLDPVFLNSILIEEYVLEPDWEKAMERIGETVTFMDSGMVVPGVTYRPKRVKNTVVRGCKPEEVLPLINELPGGVETLLLEGEHEE